METVSLNHPLHLEAIDSDTTHPSVDVIASTAISEAQQSASGAVSRQTQVKKYISLIEAGFAGILANPPTRAEHEQAIAQIRVPWDISWKKIDPLVVEALLKAKIPKMAPFRKN